MPGLCTSRSQIRTSPGTGASAGTMSSFLSQVSLRRRHIRRRRDSARPRSTLPALPGSSRSRTGFRSAKRNHRGGRRRLPRSGPGGGGPRWIRRALRTCRVSTVRDRVFHLPRRSAIPAGRNPIPGRNRRRRDLDESIGAEVHPWFPRRLPDGGGNAGFPGSGAAPLSTTAVPGLASDAVKSDPSERTSAVSCAATGIPPLETGPPAFLFRGGLSGI